MIIGITGRIGSGKSTLANELVKAGFKEYSFAKPLKEIAEIFGFEPNTLYGTQEEKLQIHPFWNISSREFLQKLGTEVFRETLPKVLPAMNLKYSVWIQLFLLELQKNRLHLGAKNYVISDVRFLDEAKAIKENGGFIVKTYRKGQSLSNHKSEAEIDLIKEDFFLNNDEVAIEDIGNLVLSKLSFKK